MPVPYILSNPYMDANWAWTGDGTVKSVGLTAPAIFSVSGSPITTSGTLAISLATQAANLIFSGPPSGGVVAPTFRALVVGDLPASGVTATTYGDARNIPQVTFDAKGRATSATSIRVAPSVSFAQTSTVTIANTTTETTLVGSGVGSLIVAANSLSPASTLSCVAMGPHSASGSPTIRIRAYLNAIVILDTGVVTAGTSTNELWEFRGVMACRSTGISGTVMAEGFYLESAGSTKMFGMVNSSPITIDTTINQTFGVTVQWGTADPSNTISATNLTLQVWGQPV